VGERLSGEVESNKNCVSMGNASIGHVGKDRSRRGERDFQQIERVEKKRVQRNHKGNTFRRANA